MSLNWRLIVSYAAIIVITLLLAFIALLIIARPLQNRLAVLRLANQSQVLQTQINQRLQNDATLEQAVRWLDSRPGLTNNPPQVLLIDTDGNILFDSQHRFAGQHLVLPQRDNEILPTGTFNALGGQVMNYAAAPIGGDASIGLLVAAAPRTPAVPRVITELGWGFLMAGCLSLLVSLLVGALIARSISQPLKTIAAATTAVAAGDYAQQIPEKGPPEVKRVAASFNVMAGQVSAGQQAMRDFVSNVSHELKTPLTSIQGFSQAIMEGATPDEASTQRAAKIIYEEAARMTRLVEDLLDLARIDSGQIVMQKTPLDLTQILHSTLNRLRPQAAARDITLKFNLSRLPQIVGDGDRLAQVFTNLLDNAVRHTPPNGCVTVKGAVARNLPRPRHLKADLVQTSAATTLSERGDFVEVSISNTGPAIPPDDLARIFERFYQVDKSRKRGKGTGLGLAIIKEIVDAHSGSIRASSQEGIGTSFTVLLPITEADARTLISPRK